MKPVPPLSAAEVSKAKNIARHTPEDTDSDPFMEKVNERVDYIWREMARMAGIDLRWWDYTNECFNCDYGTIGVEEGEFVMPKNPTELQEAMGWIFEDYRIKLNYLSMPNEEWKADFKRDAEILLAGEKKRREKEARKKQNLLQQAFEDIKEIESPEDIKGMSVKRRIAIMRLIFKTLPEKYRHYQVLNNILAK